MKQRPARLYHTQQRATSVNITRQLTQPKSRSATPFHFLGIFLIFIAVCGSIYTLLRIAVITEIHCTQRPTQQPCDEPLHAEFQQFIGKPIFFTNIEAITSHITTTHPTYQHFIITKQPPRTLSITVELSPMVYQLQSAENQFLIINTTGGITTSNLANTTLPTIKIPSELTTTLQKEPTLSSIQHAQFQQLIETTKNTAIAIERLEWVHENEISLHLKDQKTILVKLEGLSQQLEIAQKIIEVPIEEKPWNTLDLRFDNPILR